MAIYSHRNLIIVTLLALILFVTCTTNPGDDTNGPDETNHAPVAVDSSESTLPGNPVTGSLHASDVDGDPLSYSIVSQGSKGTAVINDASTGSFTYTPNAGAINTDSFTFKANDGKADSNIATVTITDVAPATPTGASATAGDQRVTVNWTPVSGADSYTVYWSDTPSTGTGGTAISGVQPPFYHDGISNGSNYYYVVTAVNAAGESGASSEVSATPANILLSSLSYSDGNLSSCIATATTGMSYVHEVTTLGSDCTSQGITDITGLEALTSLTNLNLGNNSISDISPLQVLTQITVLSLSGNSIDDVQPLSRMTGMTQLTLNNNNLTSLSGLEEMTSMVTLYLNNNTISDVSPLADMASMTELRIYVNNISNVAPLSGLSSLVTLMLDDNNISDLSALTGLTTLQYLYLARNNIEDVSPLASLMNLKFVSMLTNNIGGQNVGNVDNLTTLTSATAIYLGDNINMSCTEVSTLISALGSPPVNLSPTGSSSGYPHSAIPGTNCTNP